MQPTLAAPELKRIPIGQFGHGFTQVPNALILGPGAARLSDRAFRLAVITLARTGELGTHTAELSYSFLHCCTGASDDRIQGMKRDLCSRLPDVFSVVPGNRKLGTGDGIRVDRTALTAAHMVYLNQREDHRAQQESRPVTVIYAVATGHTPETGAAVSRNSGYPLTDIPGTLAPETGEKKDTSDREISTQLAEALLRGEQPAQTLAQHRSASVGAKEAHRTDHDTLMATYDAMRVTGMVRHCELSLQLRSVLDEALSQVNGDIDQAAGNIRLATIYVGYALHGPQRWWKGGPPSLLNVARHATGWAGKARAAAMTMPVVIPGTAAPIVAVSQLTRAVFAEDLA